MAGVAGTAQRSGTDRRQTGHIHLLRRHGKRHHLRPERRFSHQRAERLHRRHQSHAGGNRRPAHPCPQPTEFCAKAEEGKPFVWQVGTAEIDCPDITILQIPRRYSSRQPAQHLIGYTSQGVGVAGLEADYDSILRSVDSRWSVTFPWTAAAAHLPARES